MERALAERQRDAWDAAAEMWDGFAGEITADDAGPVASLLGVVPGAEVLDLGCGNGRWSRWLADQGAVVTAVDGTRALVEVARRRNTRNVTYEQMDLTDSDGLSSLGTDRFDAALCVMVLMNLADIDPLADATASALKPGAPLVITEIHPCFPSLWQPAPESRVGGHPTVLGRLARMWMRLTSSAPAVQRAADPIIERVVPYALAVTRAKWRYLDRAVLEQAVEGERAPHLRFHRPLEVLLGTFLSRGFVIDRWIEPEAPHLPGRTTQLTIRLRAPGG